MERAGAKGEEGKDQWQVNQTRPFCIHLLLNQKRTQLFLASSTQVGQCYLQCDIWGMFAASSFQKGTVHPNWWERLKSYDGFLLIFLELEKLLFAKSQKLNSQAVQNEATWLQEWRRVLKKKSNWKNRGEKSAAVLPAAVAMSNFRKKEFEPSWQIAVRILLCLPS